MFTADLNPAINDDIDFGNRMGGFRFMDDISKLMDGLDSFGKSDWMGESDWVGGTEWVGRDARPCVSTRDVTRDVTDDVTRDAWDDISTMACK